MIHVPRKCLDRLFFNRTNPLKINGWGLTNHPKLKSGKSFEPNLHDFWVRSPLIFLDLFKDGIHHHFSPPFGRIFLYLVPSIVAKQIQVFEDGFLGGGFKYFVFSPLAGEMIQFDEHIFQLG